LLHRKFGHETVHDVSQLRKSSGSTYLLICIEQAKHAPCINCYTLNQMNARTLLRYDTYCPSAVCNVTNTCNAKSLN